MGVILEALNVIVPCRVLDTRYLGGTEAYERHCPNGTFCKDQHLTRVGFMHPDDVAAFIQDLLGRGLTFLKDGECQDIVVVDEHQGPTAPCPWFEGGRHSAGFSYGWLKGEDPNPVSCPPGWELGRSEKLHFVPRREESDHTLPMAIEGALDIHLHYASGKEVYVGRTSRGRSN